LREDQIGQYSIEELGQFWTLTKSKQASHFHYEIADYRRQIEELNAKQAAQSLDKVAKMQAQSELKGLKEKVTTLSNAEKELKTANQKLRSDLETKSSDTQLVRKYRVKCEDLQL